MLLAATVASAQSSQVVGSVRDQIGQPLPGVVVELITGGASARRTETDAQGGYRFD